MQRLPARRCARLGLLSGLLAMALWPLAVRAETGLVASFETNEHEVAAAGSGSPGEKTTQGTLVARLTPTMLAVREGDTERIYDFASQRAYTLDHARKLSYAWSLYAVPGFRVLEFENRKVLARMMAAIGQKADMVDVEAEMGILQDPPAKLRFEEKQDGATRVFFLNKREATRFTPSATPLPAGLAPALAHFYLYEARLHPRVREALLREPRLPQQLDYSWQRTGTEISVRWVLQGASEAEMDLAADARRYPAAPFEDKGLMATAWRVAGAQAGTPPAAADYRARADKLLAEGRPFEAFLVLSELSFATGEVPEEATRRAADAAAADPRMQAYARAMQIESGKQDPKEALRLLEPLDAAQLEGGAAVYVQRANQYVRLGDGSKALQAFSQALDRNPFMIGPWVDAGQLYYRGYRVPSAWACWGAARAIAPGSPLLKPVDDLEAMLRRQHPEFF